jgi:hypothetical protein
MKLKISILFISCLIFAKCLLAQTSNNSKIEYIQSSVWSSQSNVIKLLDGSRWYSTSAFLVLPASDIFIIIEDDKGNGTAYCDGSDFPVNYLSGTPITSNGWYYKVVDAFKDGAVLQLSDGSIWKVDDYYTYYTGYWLPPYPVIVTSNEFYMFNLKKGKKIWVNKVKE